MKVKKEIKLNENKIYYLVKRSNRARMVRLAVHYNGTVVVTVPNGVTKNVVEKFLQEKTDWILRKLDFFKQNKNLFPKLNSKKDYLRNKKRAYEFIMDRINYFCKKYNFKFKKISVRNQKTRWGSCSKQGNLNFNYRLIYLSEKQADYIIVHELCHLKQLNHSKKFWKLVEEIIPNYLEIRKELKKAIF